MSVERNTTYTIRNMLHSEMEALLSESKLIKHLPGVLAGFLIYIIIQYLRRALGKWNREQNLNCPKSDGEEHIAVNFNDQNDGTTDELQPALEEKPHVPFTPGHDLNPNGARKMYELMNGRRSIRTFNATNKPSITIVEDCIRAAGTAPSGAHTEPWTFCVVEKPELKQQIREIVEYEEQINYSQRMHAQWVTDLRPLRTKPVKKYLSDAPYLILVFKQTYGTTTDGRKKLHYYNEISTSIATGILLCALQAAGLCSLVTTPLNCGPALRRLLERPVNEKLLILLAVGYSDNECHVPDLQRKSLENIMVKM